MATSVGGSWRLRDQDRTGTVNLYLGTEVKPWVAAGTSRQHRLSRVNDD
jgi:hypothetical protein